MVGSGRVPQEGPSPNCEFHLEGPGLIPFSSDPARLKLCRETRPGPTAARTTDQVRDQCVCSSVAGHQIELDSKREIEFDPELHFADILHSTERYENGNNGRMPLYIFSLTSEGRANMGYAQAVTHNAMTKRFLHAYSDAHSFVNELLVACGLPHFECVLNLSICCFKSITAPSSLREHPSPAASEPDGLELQTLVEEFSRGEDTGKLTSRTGNACVQQSRCTCEGPSGRPT